MRKLITTIFILFSTYSFSQTQQPIDTTTYHLTGKLSDFNLLFSALTQPDDITTNQKKALAAWIQKDTQPLYKKDSVTVKELPNKTKPK